MHSTIGKHFIFFQESTLLFISSLKKNTLRVCHMLCSVLGAEEIQNKEICSVIHCLLGKIKGMEYCQENTASARLEARQ